MLNLSKLESEIGRLSWRLNLTVFQDLKISKGCETTKSEIFVNFILFSFSFQILQLIFILSINFHFQQLLLPNSFSFTSKNVQRKPKSFSFSNLPTISRNATQAQLKSKPNRKNKSEFQLYNLCRATESQRPKKKSEKLSLEKKRKEKKKKVSLALPLEMIASDWRNFTLDFFFMLISLGALTELLTGDGITCVICSGTGVGLSLTKWRAA